MKKEALENINSDLFKPFNPEEELWIVGGTGTVTGGPTQTPTSMDAWADADYDFAE